MEAFLSMLGDLTTGLQHLSMVICLGYNAKEEIEHAYYCKFIDFYTFIMLTLFVKYFE